MLSTPKAKGELFLASSLCDGLEDNDIKQVTTLLLNKEADPNVLIPSHGVTPFHLVIGNDSEAFAEEVTKLFLRHGGDPNVRSAEGLTPVHVAAAWGRTRVLELLLEAGGDPLRLDDDGRSPFHYAFDGKFYNVVSVLGKFCGKHKAGRDKRIEGSTSDSGKEDSLFKDFTEGEESIGSTEFFGSSAVKSSPKTEDYKGSSRSGPSFESSIDILELKKMNERNEPETEDEKWLVNRIIDQLSTSLRGTKGRKAGPSPEVSATSPTTTNDERTESEPEEQFYPRSRARKCFGTPKYRRKVLSERTGSPCPSFRSASNRRKPLERVSLFRNPEDSIISKSPNLLVQNRNVLREFTPRESRYFTPRPRYEDAHSRERRDIVRSTPRRRKLSRNCTRKVPRKSGYDVSNSLSSPETSFTPEPTWPRNELRVKLHESKYEQEVVEPAADIFSANDRAGDRERTDHHRLSCQSLVSVQEEYKYEDPDEGVTLLERRLYVLPACESTENIACESLRSANPEMSGNVPPRLDLTDRILRQRLRNLGDDPGPITSTTRYVYQKRLVKLEATGPTTLQRDPVESSNEARDGDRRDLDPFLDYGDWVNRSEPYRTLERNAFMEFVSPTPSKRWREGNNKTSFNYLLLDSRITRDLPYRSVSLTNDETWRTFVSAIFYVGKGKRARPYAHLYDAFNAWVSKGPEQPQSQKIRRILEIWNAGYGVVCLHVFLNTMPVEAFTREAAMIQALGVENLANAKSGEYYGPAAGWNAKDKRGFGRYLLYKALHILLQEGERQLFPEHL